MSVCEWADCWVLATDWTSSGVSQRREGCGSAGYPLLTPALWCGVGGLLYGGKGGGGHACQGRWVDSVFSRKVLSLRGWAWITHTPPPASHSSCHTHTETLNPEPGLGHLSHAEERGWKKLWTWSACFEVGAVILRALSIEGQAGPPSLVSSRPSCNYSTHLKCKAQGDRGGQVSSDTLSLVKHIVQTSKEISSPKPVVGAGASESNAVMMEPRGLTPLCALTDCSLKSTSLVGG